MKLTDWLRALFTSDTSASHSAPDPTTDRPLSSVPLPSSKLPKPKSTAPKTTSKPKDSYSRLVESMVSFLQQPTNGDLRQEVLDGQRDLALTTLKNAMQKAGALPPGNYHPGDYGDALHDALAEIKKTLDTPSPSNEAMMDVVLESVGPSKVMLVQPLRQLTGLDLKGVMGLMDHLPTVILSNVAASKAQATQKTLGDLGASVTIRPAT